MKTILVLLVLALSAPALAQAPSQPQQVDPRLAPAAINTLQAMIALRDAEVKVLHEDAAKREADWADYSKSLWQPPASVATGPTDK